MGGKSFDWDQHERLLFKTVKTCNNKQGPVVVKIRQTQQFCQCAAAVAVTGQLPVQAHRCRHTGARLRCRSGSGAQPGRETGVPRMVAGLAAAVRVVQCSGYACGADTEAESSFAHGGHN